MVLDFPSSIKDRVFRENSHSRYPFNAFQPVTQQCVDLVLRSALTLRVSAPIKCPLQSTAQIVLKYAKSQVFEKYTHWNSPANDWMYWKRENQHTQQYLWILKIISRGYSNITPLFSLLSSSIYTRCYFRNVIPSLTLATDFRVIIISWTYMLLLPFLTNQHMKYYYCVNNEDNALILLLFECINTN